MMTEKYQDTDQDEKNDFIAVARIEVTKWYANIKSRRMLEASPPGLRELYMTVDIGKVEHVKHMLRQIKVEHGEAFAAMEFETEFDASMAFANPGDSWEVEAGCDGQYMHSDWLLGVRSYNELQSLVDNGFTYMPKGFPIKDGMFELEHDAVISVSLFAEGSAVLFSHVRAPFFATKNDIAEAFAEYGQVQQIEREHWDLPEDASNSKEIKWLEETGMRRMTALSIFS
eukprot:SAG31_NODE_7687_length_1617_cov_1.337945_2_plen_228_part_00